MSSDSAEKFVSPLSHWDKQASVRRKDRRILGNGGEKKLPFSPKLVPLVGHNLILERGESTAYNFLGLRLFDYLRFTDFLETEAVVPAAMLIARQQLDIRFPDGMAFDGRKIATDEMYHAQCADDLLRQMSQHTGIPIPQYLPPTFLAELDARLRNLPKEVRPVALLFFSIVSETLVTSILKDVPRDNRVLNVVRDVVGDHNEDEARHSHFFTSVLNVVWDQLDIRQKDYVGPLVPIFIKMFLEPDRAVLSRCLSNVGFNLDEIDRMWQETYPKATILQDVCVASTPTVQRFERVGAFEHQATQEAFEFHGLIRYLPKKP